MSHGCFVMKWLAIGIYDHVLRIDHIEYLLSGKDSELPRLSESNHLPDYVAGA